MFLFTELDYEAEALNDGRYPEFDHTLGPGVIIGVYIVEPNGRADRNSFRVVRTSRQGLERSIRAFLPTKTFRPAMLDESPVRSCVQQEFRFQYGN